MIAFQSIKFRCEQKKRPLLVTDIASMKLIACPTKLCKSFAKLIQVISISRAETADRHNARPDILHSSSLTILAPDIFHN